MTLKLERAGNKYHWYRFVYTLVPVGSMNRDDPCATAERCGGKFSPTSLAEEEPEWFISAAARTTSSSSQIQAFRPTLLLIACGLTGPYAGLDPRPILCYKSFPVRTGVVGGIFFSF